MADTLEVPGNSPAAEEKLSHTEAVKTGSNYLRGTIAEELTNDLPYLSDDNLTLLKHHGTYQQDNRDLRAQARAEKAPGGKYFSFMIRTGVPGGVITSRQMLAHLDLCETVGDQTLRITTRQGLQLHGVLKQNLKHAIATINHCKLTTLAACGDVRRNLMCSPAPYKGDQVYDQMQAMSDLLAVKLRPQTTAYQEIWLTDMETGEKTDLSERDKTRDPFEVEPLYGAAYMPRKFKFGIGLPGDNSGEAYAQDMGLLAICEDYNVVGYNVLVGGSFGTTPSAAKTFPAVAKPMAYAPTDKVLEVAKAVMKVQRDFGNRSDRKVARLKYLIHNWGVERFKQKVEEYLGEELEPPRPVEVTGYNDTLGWHEQGDGRWFYGLSIENGRIKDTPTWKLKTALREACSRFDFPLRLTAQQNVLFFDIEEHQKEELLDVFRRHQVALTEDISTVRRWSMACPALPMCGLSVTESERILPSLIDSIEQDLAELGLQDEVFTTHMTGCPNGCARPYNSDIGIVGKAKNKYTIFLGGHREGDRLNWIYKDMVPEDQVVPTLRPVFAYFAQARAEGESFGDFCHRMGPEELLRVCDN